MSLRESIDYLYDVISPWIFVGISVTYFIPGRLAFVPYVLVVGCAALGIIFGAKIVQTCWYRGWIRTAWRWLNYYLSKAWIQALLGLRYIRDTWLGRTLGILAVVNNVLFAPWVYHNVDLLRWIRSTMQLIRSCVKYIMDPPELLAAFDIWKDSVPVFGRVLRGGKEYVELVLAECRRGSIRALFMILMMTLALGAGAVTAYAIWNFLRPNSPSRARAYLWGNRMWSSYAESRGVLPRPGSGTVPEEDSSSDESASSRGRGPRSPRRRGM